MSYMYLHPPVHQFTKLEAYENPAPADDFFVHIVDGMDFIQVHKSTRASTFASELASTYFIIIAALLMLGRSSRVWTVLDNLS